MLAAIAGGAGGALGSQLRAGLSALVRRPFRRGHATGDGTAALPSGSAELVALERSPDDEQRAIALAEVLVARADADSEFREALQAWWEQASQIQISEDVTNTISGGTFSGPVLQGRDIQATFQLPALVPVALAQLPAVTAGFTGRDDELAVLAGLLDPAGTSGPVVVSVVAGLPGWARPPWPSKRVTQPRNGAASAAGRCSSTCTAMIRRRSSRRRRWMRYCGR